MSWFFGEKKVSQVRCIEEECDVAKKESDIRGKCLNTFMTHCKLRCASRRGESACCRQTDIEPFHILTFLQNT